MSDNKLKDIATKLEDRSVTELTTYIGSAHDELVVNRRNSMIPEIIFKQYFLDFFFNMNEHPDSSTLYLKWIELAGGVYNEVDVIDMNGNILFTVPTLYSRPSANESVLKNISFGNIVGTFESKANRLYVDGINYLNRELSSIGGLLSNTDTDSNTNKWINVFRRYAVNTTPVVATVAKQDLELDYN